MKKYLILLLIVGFCSGLAVSLAYASLTINSSTLTSDTTLSLVGSGSSTIDVGIGTLSLQTTNNGPITAGSGLFTIPNLRDGLGNKYSTSTFSSSTVSLIINNPTSTAPSFAEATWDQQRLITYIACYDYSGTTTIDVWNTTNYNTSTKNANIIAGDFPCGTMGNNTTSFISATLLANYGFVVNVTTTAGTPTQARVVIKMQKQ